MILSSIPTPKRHVCEYPFRLQQPRATQQSAHVVIGTELYTHTKLATGPRVMANWLPCNDRDRSVLARWHNRSAPPQNAPAHILDSCHGHTGSRNKYMLTGKITAKRAHVCVCLHDPNQVRCTIYAREVNIHSKNIRSFTTAVWSGNMLVLVDVCAHVRARVFPRVLFAALTFPAATVIHSEFNVAIFQLHTHTQSMQNRWGLHRQSLLVNRAVFVNNSQKPTH